MQNKKCQSFFACSNGIGQSYVSDGNAILKVGAAEVQSLARSNFGHMFERTEVVSLKNS